MNIKRILVNGLVLALLPGILSGCSAGQRGNIVYDSGQNEERPQTNLTFFGYKYEALNVMAIEESLHGFMDQYPDISISYDGIKSPGYYGVLDKRIETGNGDDIFMVDHERVLELGNQGKLEDLSGLSTIENFSSLAMSQVKAGENGITYLPTSISAFGFYCNLDLLKEHGQEIPKDVKELEAVCDYFVSQGITPIVANNDISLKTVAIAKALFPLYQHEDTDAELARFNRGEADLPKALYPGFQLVEQMIKRGWVSPEVALNTAKTKDDLVLYAKGEQPFMLTGAWAVPRLRELEPDFEFEVHPYPILEDGSVLVINIDTRISVNAESARREEAKMFVEYLTQSDVMWKFVNSQSSFSPLKENRLAQEKAIQPVGHYLNNGRSMIGSDDNLHLPIWDLSRQCIVEMLKGGSADGAVSRMEVLLDEWLAEQQGD